MVFFHMAKNFTFDLKGKYPHELAEDDPELMLLWGEINNAWDNIERLLYSAFDAMLTEETQFATQAIFYSQTSHAARRKMVEELAKYALLNRPTTMRKLENAIRRVKARSDDRNKLAHGMWSVGIDLATGEQGPQRMAMSSSIIPNKDSFYPKSRLAQIRDKMRDTVIALRDAIEPIDAAKRANAIVLMERHMAKATPLEEPPAS